MALVGGEKNDADMANDVAFQPDTNLEIVFNNLADGSTWEIVRRPIRLPRVTRRASNQYAWAVEKYQTIPIRFGFGFGFYISSAR